MNQIIPYSTGLASVTLHFFDTGPGPCSQSVFEIWRKYLHWWPIYSYFTISPIWLWSAYSRPFWGGFLGFDPLNVLGYCRKKIFHFCFIDHLQSGVVYAFGRVCPSVCHCICMYACMSVCQKITFKRLEAWRRNFILEHPRRVQLVAEASLSYACLRLASFY